MKTAILAAAAALLSAPASAAAEDPLSAAQEGARVILAEGASGVSYRGELSPGASWRDIARRADPAWPVIPFPDGFDYRVFDLCVHAGTLRVVGKPTAEVCRVPSEEPCKSPETIALAVPVERSRPRYRVEVRAFPPRLPDGGVEPNDGPVLFTKDFVIPRCDAPPAAPSREPLTRSA
jgi:hypothetical protein